MTEFSKIKDAYTEKFPTDDFGFEIDENATFLDLFDALDHYRNVYEVIGVEDSVIRERCFSMLATIMDCDYDYIYDQWLQAA